MRPHRNPAPRCRAASFPSPPPFDTLSQRELEVAALIVVGQTRAEIAKLLECSDKTIDTHKLHIRKKLCVRTDAQLTLLAVRSGFISMHDGAA